MLSKHAEVHIRILLYRPQKKKVKLLFIILVQDVLEIMKKRLIVLVGMEEVHPISQSISLKYQLIIPQNQKL